jgi:hypothetical protein
MLPTGIFEDAIGNAQPCTIEFGFDFQFKFLSRIDSGYLSFGEVFGGLSEGDGIADFGDVNPIFIAQISGAREFVEGGFGAVDQD